MLYLTETGELTIPKNGLTGSESFTLTFKRYAGAEVILSNQVPFFVGINEITFQVFSSDFSDGQYELIAETTGYRYSEDLLVNLPRKGIVFETSDVTFNFVAPTYLPNGIGTFIIGSTFRVA